MTKHVVRYRAVEDLPNYEYDHRLRNGHSVTVQRCRTYFTGPDRVMYIESDKRTGLNQHTGKQWWRWQNTNVKSVHRNSAGKFVTRSRVDKRWDGHLDYRRLKRDAEWNALFTEIFDKPFSFPTIHPLAPHYEILSLPLPTGFSGSLKEADLRSQVASLFGKTRVRRDLMRAVAQSYPNAIMLAREFRGLVPIDWLVKFLMDNPRQPNIRITPYLGGLRPLLYQMQPRAYRHLLNSQMAGYDIWYYMRDITNPVGVIARVGVPTDGFRNFYELHDLIFANDRELRRSAAPIAPQDVPVSPLSSALDGLQVGTLTLRMPRKTSDLHEWGEEMRNCIGGYAGSILNAKRTRELGGIYEGDKLIGNFEIINKRLSQLLGKFNQPLPVGDRKPLEAAFTKQNILVTDSYWGAS